MKYFSCFFVFSLFIISACGDDDASDMEPTTSDDGVEQMEECDPEISLASDIKPIIDRNCAVSGCHLDRQNPLFNDNAAIISNAQRILARTSAGTMPPAGALDAELVAQISCWVDAGAMDN